MENEGNLANYSELQEHIKRIGNKLNGLQPGSEQYTESKEDLEDYYERLIQMRKMRETTLMEELQEKNEELLATSMQLRKRSRWSLFAVLVACVICIVWIEDRTPGMVKTPFTQVMTTISESKVLTAVIIGIITHYWTRWRMAGVIKNKSS